MSVELIIATIIGAVMAALPTLASCFSAILSYFKNRMICKETKDAILTEFQATKEEVVKTKEFEQLKTMYQGMAEQYYTLLKAHREILTKLDRVARKEEEYEGKSIHEEK